MNADLLSDAIGKAEADAIGRAKALADRIDAEYGDAGEAEFNFGLTYEFLNDINELSDAVSGLVHGRSDEPALWKERAPEINELEHRLEAWNACVGRLYLRAHRTGVYQAPSQKDTIRAA
jgi:hypothetical protein